MLPHQLPSKLATFNDYMQYLENIAYYHNDINHTDGVKRFYTNPDDLVGNTSRKYPLMLVIAGASGYKNERDALFFTYSFDIYILFDTDKSTREQDRQLKISNAGEIAKEIIKLIEEESEPSPNTAFKYFNPEQVQGEPIDDPMLTDNAIGWMVPITIGNQINLVVQTSKWKHKL